MATKADLSPAARTVVSECVEGVGAEFASHQFEEKSTKGKGKSGTPRNKKEAGL